MSHEDREDAMYPQVVQFETRRLQYERELQFARERTRTRVSLATAAGSTRTTSLLSRLVPRRAGWSRRPRSAHA
jgi:hypothetical protein